MALVVLGGVFGLTRVRARLDKAIEARRELMKIEIYIVNQLLAMRGLAGGGVDPGGQGDNQGKWMFLRPQHDRSTQCTLCVDLGFHWYHFTG